MVEKDIVEIGHLKEEVREKIVLAMRRRVVGFKSCVTDEKESEHRLYQFVECKDYRDEYHFVKGEDYGCKDDNYYYCFFPKDIQFIYQNSHWCSNCIFFDDKFMCWFVYDKDKNDFVTFEALDTESQIAFLRMLGNFLNFENWTSKF